MNFFTRRRWKKQVKHLLNEAQHARHMREDIVDPALIEACKTKEEALRTVWQGGGDETALDRAGEDVQKAIAAIYPRGKDGSVRELVEVVAVALIVAMGLRAYFIQPFKIPTGSMQPTLNGITYTPVDRSANITDRYPLRFVKFLFTGRSYQEWKSPHSGLIRDIQVEPINHRMLIDFEGRGEIILPSSSVSLRVKPGSRVREGDLLAVAWKHAGDHIFVDKIRYNFSKPKIGQVFVFNTVNIDHPQIKKNNYYIKRICGIPGDIVSIRPPELIRNGQPEQQVPSIVRVMEAQDGYNGYFLAEPPRLPIRPSKLYTPQRSVKMGYQEYLPLGDNSQSSLDGRYFGTVEFDQVVGPAFLVYWPFTDHWGLIN